MYTPNFSERNSLKLNVNERKTYLTNMLYGKSVAVLGIGVSNLPLIDFLLSYGAKVCARDMKDREKLGGDLASELEEKGVKLICGENYLENITEDIVFRSPGIRFDKPTLLEAAKRGAKITSEMQLYFDITPAHNIGITGSDGKSTTTTVISKILEEDGKKTFLGGNIGFPLLPRVEQMDFCSYSVAELSSFQLHTMTKSPEIAVITNVTPNHLDYHLGMQEYIDAKANVMKYQDASSRVVLNWENPVTRELGKSAKGTVVYFSSKSVPDCENRVYEKDGTIYYNEEAILVSADIKIPGRHNVENYMAAIGALYGLVSTESIREVAKNFGGVAHRCQFVRELRGVKYYNSSIDSSPTRTAAALSNFPQKTIVLCGGYDKNIPFEPLAAPLCEKAKAVILCGATKDKIKNALINSDEYKNASEKPEIYETSDLAESVKIASQIARSGDIVLLSPACASFDAFKNFEERGNFFVSKVMEIE